MILLQAYDSFRFFKKNKGKKKINYAGKLKEIQEESICHQEKPDNIDQVSLCRNQNPELWIHSRIIILAKKCANVGNQANIFFNEIHL